MAGALGDWMSKAESVAGGAAHRVQDAAASGAAGAGAGMKPWLERGQGVFDATAKMGRNLLSSQLPGGEMMLEQVGQMLKSDIPGGFNMGTKVIVKALKKPGLSGYLIDSGRDQFFMAEEKEIFHCCCCWVGAGPVLYLKASSAIDAEDVLRFTAHRKCPFASPEIDVELPNGEMIAGADEHTCCCLGAETETQVHEKESFRVTGWNPWGEHAIEWPSQPGRQVGSITHTCGSMIIEFPKEAKASAKVALLAGALLFDLRWK